MSSNIRNNTENKTVSIRRKQNYHILSSYNKAFQDGGHKFNVWLLKLLFIKLSSSINQQYSKESK